MSRKRIVAGLAAAVIAAGLCAGCGNGGDNGPSTPGNSEVGHERATVPPAVTPLPSGVGPAHTPGPKGSENKGGTSTD